MKDITAFIQNELYPSLFERLDVAFPSLQFLRVSEGWWSCLKMDGTEPATPRKDKTKVTRKYPHRALEQGGETKDLITLYRELHNLRTDMKAITELCILCGLQLPQMDSEGYRAYQEKQERLEAAAAAMRAALHTDEGRATLAYLTDTRHYTEDFIKDAELGYCSPATAAALRPLFTYKNREGEEVCALPYGTGNLYTLAIPYRNGGRIMGFVFRTINPDTTPKYKDAFVSAAASKKYHLFGLTGLRLTGGGKAQDITIVEGELDALRAQAAGLTNVVAASGGQISDEALAEARRRGVKRVTLLFDTEATQESQNATNKKIERAIEAVFRAELYPLVANLPSDGGKVDVDSYLTSHSAKELQGVVNEAISGTAHLYTRMVQKAIDAQGGEGQEATCKHLHEFKSQVIELANRPYMPPTDRDLLFGWFSTSTGEQITKDSIQEEADKLKAIEDSSRQREETKKLLSEAFALANGNTPDGVAEALKLIQENVTKLREISTEGEFSHLLSLPTVEGIRNRWKERPTGIYTKYAFGQGDKQERFMLQSGALTFICAPTSHGKSRMLENLALDMATEQAEGDTLYFSFEEDRDAVEMQLLNVLLGEDVSRNNMRTISAYYTHGDTQYFSRNRNTNGNYPIEEFEAAEARFMQLLTSGKLRVMSENYDSSKLISAIRYLHKNLPKVRAVFVDYIQLLHTRGAEEGRKAELADMCRELMSLAKETKLPIVLAAQLNREALSPIEMAAQNIAEASEIEHSANTIMVLWNSINEPLQKSNYYYTKGGERKLSDAAQKVEKLGFEIGKEGKIYAKLVKNRGGARNIDAVFNFHGNTGRITQPDYTPQEPQQGNLFADETSDNKKLTLPF